MKPASTLTRSRFALALVLAPLILQAFAVYVFGVNVPTWDEFYYVDFIREVREGGDWLRWMWIQHNEHRVIPMKLAMAPLALATQWNTKAEMYLSVLLAGVAILGLWRLYRLSGGADLLLFAPVAWLVCSWSQFQNMLYGMMICHYFTLLGVIWALVFLARRNWMGLALAVLCGLMASFSIANGLLVWPVGFLLLLVWRVRWPLLVSWAGASAAAILLYFYRFQFPPGHTATMTYDLRGIYRVASFGVASLGAPLAAGNMDWSRAAGLAVLLLIAAILLGWWREGRERLRRESLLGALILFSLLSSAMITVGRVAMGIPPLESRYIAYSSLALMGGYLLVTLWGRREWLAGALVLLIPGLIAANLYGLRESKQWRNTRLQEKFRLQTFESQRDEDLAGLYFVSELRRIAPYLRDERLGPFNEPQDVLLLVRWREGQPAGEILPERPVEQAFVCPVEELREAGVPVDSLGRKNQATLLVSLWEGGRKLGSRTVPGAALAATQWISVPLEEPLEDCQGRRLRVRLESPDAAPGNAVSVWTYPRYYEGELRQAGAPALPGRVVGLELNAFHFGLLN